MLPWQISLLSVQCMLGCRLIFHLHAQQDGKELILVGTSR